METRANYILIGVFTILGFLALLGFLVWFTQAELDRQFAYYDVRFSNVSGVSQASSVRFAGLTVGQVTELRLSEERDGTVTARLEVAADTPVRTSSVATIEALGVTGVADVEISAGDADDPLLAVASEEEVPEILAGRSTLQTLLEDAPAIVEQTLILVEDISTLFGPENRARFENIMINLNDSSEQLNSTLTEFATVANTVGTSVADIATFTEGLEGISTSVESTLQVADDALAAISDLSQHASVTLDAGTETLNSATRTLDSADSFIGGELRIALNDFAETSTTLRVQTQTLGTQAGSLMTAWRETGLVATARLSQTEQVLNDADTMIARLTETLETIDGTASSVTSFVEADARPALAQISQVAANLDAALVNDLPGIVADVREATETANLTIAAVGADLTSATGRLDDVFATAETTFANVADTFARANGTLTAIDEALATGKDTLRAAGGAFASADALINDELSGLSGELVVAVNDINSTLGAVAEDVPALTEDLRVTAELARTTLTDLSGIVQRGEAPVNAFLTQGLPQFSRLAVEGQRLLTTLEQLTRRIERDPARYLLGREAPEFQR